MRRRSNAPRAPHWHHTRSPHTHTPPQTAFLQRISAASIVERACAECVARFEVLAEAPPSTPQGGPQAAAVVFLQPPEEEEGDTGDASCWSLGAADDVAPRFSVLETLAARAVAGAASGSRGGSNGRSAGSHGRSASHSPRVAAAAAPQHRGQTAGEGEEAAK